MKFRTEKLIDELKKSGCQYGKFLSMISGNALFKNEEDTQLAFELSFTQKLNEIYNQGVEEDYVWEGGSFEVYKRNYERRLHQAIIDYDISEKLFIRHEKGFRLCILDRFQDILDDDIAYGEEANIEIDFVRSRLFIHFGVHPYRIKTDTYTEDVIVEGSSRYYEFCGHYKDKIFSKIRIQVILKNEFLNRRLLKLKEENNDEDYHYYHTIFKTVEGERVFYGLHKYYKKKNNKVANYSFIFRAMVESGYLTTPFTSGRNHKMFIVWLSSFINDGTFIDIDRIITINRIGDLLRKYEKYEDIIFAVQKNATSPHMLL